MDTPLKLESNAQFVFEFFFVFFASNNAFFKLVAKDWLDGCLSNQDIR